MDNLTNIYEPLKPSRLMMKMVLVSALIIIVIGAVVYRSLAVIPFALGVMATSGLNIFKLRMLERTVQKVMNTEDPEMGKNIVRLQYLLRYLLTGIVLVAVGLIHNFTSPPPFYSDRGGYIAVWATLFPNAPAALLEAPFISMWGALAGIFTLQLSVIIVRSFKLEKDGEHFVKYVDDEDEKSDEQNGGDDGNCNENAVSDGDSAISNVKEDDSE